MLVICASSSKGSAGHEPFSYDVPRCAPQSAHLHAVRAGHAEVRVIRMGDRQGSAQRQAQGRREVRMAVKLVAILFLAAVVLCAGISAVATLCGAGYAALVGWRKLTA